MKRQKFIASCCATLFFCGFSSVRQKPRTHNICIAAIRARPTYLNILSLSIIGFGLDRFIIVLSILNKNCVTLWASACGLDQHQIPGLRQCTHVVRHGVTQIAVRYSMDNNSATFKKWCNSPCECISALPTLLWKGFGSSFVHCWHNALVQHCNTSRTRENTNCGHRNGADIF